MKFVITESQQESLKNKVYQIIDNMGLKKAIKLVNGFDNLVKVLFDGDMSRVGELLEPPYFMKLRELEIPGQYWKEIFSNIFNQSVEVILTGTVYGENDYKIYEEGLDGLYDLKTYHDNGILKSILKTFLDDSWEKYEYNDEGYLTRWENSTGDWQIREYDENMNVVWMEENTGKWTKCEYNEDGDIVYREGSDGSWLRYGYDEDGKPIFIRGSKDKNINESRSNLNWFKRRVFNQEISDQEIYDLLKDIVVEGGDYVDVCDYTYGDGKDDYIREIIRGSVPTFIYSIDELGESYSEDLEEFVKKLIVDNFYDMISNHYDNYLELCDE